MDDFERQVPSEGSSQRAVFVPTPRVSTFTSLKNPNYRWFWLSMLVSFSALMMQNLARGWLVYELTSSPLALGMVSAAWGGTMLLLSIFGGAVTDRVNKRNLLIVTQTSQGIVTLVVALLILTGVIAVWQLIVAAALTGATFAFNAPGRWALIPELVGSDELMNAIALNSMGVNLMRVGAPALAGVLVAVIGVAGVYFISVGLYVAAVGALFMVSHPGKPEPRVATSVARDAVEGLRYMGRSPVILSLLSLAFVSVFIAMPYMHLMPAFVVDVLSRGASTLGWLSAAGGTGALIGALGIASLGRFRRKGWLMLAIALAFGVLLAVFALSRSLAVALVVIFGVGLSNNAYLVLNNTLIQTNVPDWVRGRVMSIYAMTFALPFLGALLVGALAERIGVALVIAGCGVLVALYVLGMGVFHRRLRRLE
ncbi:MAG: MFS transporter [Chloroflexota bacterium]